MKYRFLYVLLVCTILLVTGCGSSKATTDTEASTEEILETIYADCEGINYYLNRFNSVNPDSAITSDMPEKYHHHGTDHDYQVTYISDGFDFCLTGGDIGENLEVDVQAVDPKTNDDYKAVFFKYAKGFNPDFSDSTLEDYWNQLLEDLTNSVEFDEFECDLRTNDDKIIMLVIDGKNG